MIKLDKVNKYYYKGKANQIHVIDNTSMTLPDRGIFCLLGPSGCGKTTLLNVIGGLDSVDSGTITINDQLITRFSSDRIDSIRNANIGYIFQNFNLLDDRTVFENVAIALRMIGIKEDAAVTSRVRYCLDKVGIDQFRNRLAGSLSGGQRQRVAIARAIVKNPTVIIADEPTGNLDSANTLEIMNIIKTISRDRLVILVTHERNIAEFYSDYVAEISDGKIVNVYDNDSSRFLDYQLENRIYLKDMEFHNELRQNNVSIDVYGDTDRKLDIKLAVRGNNIYIDTDGRYNVVDEKSNVKLVDEHYTAMDETYFDKNDFDYNAYFPSDYQARYAALYSLPKMISSGWNTVKNFKRIKKFFLLGFVFAAMFAFLAVSNVLGLLEVKPVDYRTTNGNYLTIDNPEKSEEIMDLVEELDAVAFVLPGETKKAVTLPLDDYDQTSLASEDITVSVVLTSALDPETLIAGSMPVGRHDVVLDKFVIDAFLREDLGFAVCKILHGFLAEVNLFERIDGAFPDHGDDDAGDDRVENARGDVDARDGLQHIDDRFRHHTDRPCLDDGIQKLLAAGFSFDTVDLGEPVDLHDFRGRADYPVRNGERDGADYDGTGGRRTDNRLREHPFSVQNKLREIMCGSSAAFRHERVGCVDQLRNPVRRRIGGIVDRIDLRYHRNDFPQIVADFLLPLECLANHLDVFFAVRDRIGLGDHGDDRDRFPHGDRARHPADVLREQFGSCSVHAEPDYVDSAILTAFSGTVP